MTDLNSVNNDKRLKNLKDLADEMVQIILEKKNKEYEEQLNEESIFYEVDVKSYKHKSQVFNDRNHYRMLKNFSLYKGYEDYFKTTKNINRKKNKKITVQNQVDHLKNKISIHLNIKTDDNINENNNNEEEKIDENKTKIKPDLDEDKNSKKAGKNEEEINEQDIISSDEIIEYESNVEVINKDLKKNYEIYMDPTKIDTKEREELSTKNEGKEINNNKIKVITPNYKNNKGKYLFERGMKMLNLKNKKIKKAQEIKENKIKDLFNINNFITKNSKISINKKEKHIPLREKAGELYRFRLAQIEFYKRSNLIKKQLKENEEIKQAKKNKNKIKRKSEKSWNDFVKKENEWKKKSIMKREKLLKNEYNQKIYDRPKINKSSIIMLEQKEKNKFNNNNKNTVKRKNKVNIYTKLFEDKELYDNKLKQRIHNLTPTFIPTIYRNKKQKSFNILNDVVFIKNENQRSKTTNNKQLINSNNNLFSTKNSHKFNKRTISFDNFNKKKLKKKEIVLKDESFSPKFISSLTTKRTKKGKNNINANNKKNINTKKMIVYELDINNSNFNQKKNKPKSISKTDININSFIKKLGQNACKKLNEKKINFEKNKPVKNEIINNKNENNTEIINEKEITPIKNNNDLNKENVNGNIEEKKERKIKKKKLEINEHQKFLYDLNIRDNTSNSLKQFVVLSSKKYIDFFK